MLKGHGFAETLFLKQVWWPAFGHFQWLYPEYPVEDWRGVIRFVDFAYIRNAFKMVIEIDGYQNHVQLDRQRFSEELNRQNVLVAAGYKVIRFSIDDVKDHPERCGHFVKMLLGKYIGEGIPSALTPEEKELLRYAVRSNDKIIPGEFVHTS